MSIELLLSFSKGKASKELIISKVIELIREEVNQVYRDISSSHFDSATQAMKASNSSKKPEQEIRSAIAHLRDSYNIINSLLNKKINNKFLFFSFKSDVIQRKSDKLMLYIELSKISAIISILYSTLKEINNSDEWRKKSIDSYDVYFYDEIGDRDNWVFLNENGKMVDPKYIWREGNSESEKEYSGYTSFHFHGTHMGTSSSYLGLAEGGKEYIMRIRNEQRTALHELLNG